MLLEALQSVSGGKLCLQRTLSLSPRIVLKIQTSLTYRASVRRCSSSSRRSRHPILHPSDQSVATLTRHLRFWSDDTRGGGGWAVGKEVLLPAPQSPPPPPCHCLSTPDSWRLQNQPLYLATFGEDALRLHSAMHCSLDVVEERGEAEGSSAQA